VAILKNQRHEVFAQGIAKGLSASDAFRVVTPGNPKNVDIKACQMRRQAGVEERIAELRRENDRKATLSRQQALEWLTRVITTPAGEVGPHDPLCQSNKHTTGDGWEAHEIRIPDKLGALQQLAKMCDWNSAERISVDADSLSNYLLELRSQRFLGGPVLPLGPPALPARNGENSKESQ
jgi:hypothetical protein